MTFRGIGDAEDEIKFWYEEIKINHAQDMPIAPLLKFRKNSTGGILVALWNVCIYLHGKRCTGGTAAVKCRFNRVAQMDQYPWCNVAYFYKKDLCPKRFDHAQTLGRKFQLTSSTSAT